MPNKPKNEKYIFCSRRTKMSITDNELVVALKNIKNFCAFCYNVNSQEFLELMYPDTVEEYQQEKLEMFRDNPIRFFLNLEDEKRQILVKAILERAKEMEAIKPKRKR